ncbi:metallo-beta-lactamase class B [Fictibacillus enclensis]|uniref:Beta-lactamase n=2 Tax=Fictibacillus enclensis TaxID=1017270 RepID=A0A0V8J2P6_9BACL|nr:hypothetical protein AS030_19905 [Fictibacillus enclensis]SCC36128.1 metallo-beta-lactamase class B [Fictibacillus enclensis]
MKGRMVMDKKKMGKALVCGMMAAGLLAAPFVTGAHAQVPTTEISHHQNTITNESGTVTLTQIKPHVWVHTTIGEFKGVAVPSNGLLVETSKGLLLVDSSWDDPKTDELLDVIDQHFKKPIKNAIITHWHSDRMGGIKTLKDRGIRVYTTEMTATLGMQNGYEGPDRLLDPVLTELKFGDVKAETFYPGKGHTEDNITVYFPQYKLLVGGCLIKDQKAEDLGNTADGDVQAWPASVQRVIDRYPKARTVVPGHGNVGGNSLLYHTIELLEENQ